MDPSAISKNVQVHIPIVGDVRNVLVDLLKLLDKMKVKSSPFRRKWVEQTEKWKRRFPLKYSKEPKNVIKPQYVVERIYEKTKGEAIVTTEVGQNQMWAAQFYHFEQPRHFITSGGLGTMGFGLPAAIGAYFADPDRPVVCIEGDGSFQMNMQELGTIMEYQLPIKTVIVNNGHLGMVRQWEDLFHEGFHQETNLLNPDFVYLKQLYQEKIEAIRVTKASEIRPVLQRMLSDDRPYIVDVWVDRTENVMPFIPPGKGLKDMIVD